MRLPLLLPICVLSLLSAQSTDPNRSGFPHDMIWFNVPKTLEPGVQHKGYHSAAMDKQIGYNIYLPPGYEMGRFIVRTAGDIECPGAMLPKCEP